MQIRSLLILTFVAALYGCATISEESCAYDSAYDIGYAAAMDNVERADHLSVVSKICGKQGRDIDIAEYSDGFAAGTSDFCQPEFGYRWGIKGRSYNGICANPAFGAAYEDGRRIYKVEKRRSAIRERLEEIRSKLANISKLLDEDDTLTDERKRELLRKEDSLRLERRDLIAEQASLPPI